MAEYTYKCELCGKIFTFNEPKGTPYFYEHKCVENYPELDFDYVDMGGALYRVWKPTVVIIEGS